MKYAITVLFILLTFFLSVSIIQAETIGVESLEWLTCSSDFVAIGTITSVTKSKWEGSVIYESYKFKLSKILKGKERTGEIEFVFRTFTGTQSLEELANGSDEILVFLSTYRENDRETFLHNKLVPTSKSYPLSIIRLENPGNYVIDMSFKNLSSKDEILKVIRNTENALRQYLLKNPKDSVKGFYLEFPIGLSYAAFLKVPNFMSPESKEKPF